MQQRKKPWWMISLEWDMLNSGNWELVHDGQQNPLQFEFPPEEVKYFTRKYKWIRGSGWLGLLRGVTFRYDLRLMTRDSDIIKIEFVSEDSNHRKSREMFELSERRGRA